MSTPEELRKIFIAKASPLVEQFVDAALGNAELQASSGQALTAVWELLSEIIKQAGDQKAFDIAGEGIEPQVGDVLQKVSDGKITTDQGKQYMALLQAGFDITELPKLIEALEKAE